MRAGKDNQFSRRSPDAKVERAPEGKLGGWNMHNPRAERFGKGNGLIRRTRIDEDNLHILDRLLANPIEQSSDVPSFIVGTDDNRTVHEYRLIVLQNSGQEM